MNGLTEMPMPRTLEPVRLPLRALRSSHLNSSDAAIDGLAHERAGDVAALAVLAGGSERRLACGRVDAMQRHRIDSQLSRRLREQRLHDRVLLQPAGPPLRRRRRRVREHREAAEAHRHRLVGQRAHRRRRFEIGLILVGAGILHDEHVDGGDSAVLAEADLGRAPAAMAGGGRCSAPLHG